jgi:tetratricopeptide (TPR) repeat protein
MPLDICPYLTRSKEATRCPGCEISTVEVQGREDDFIMNACLSRIKQGLVVVKNNARPKQLVLLELYKLKKLTTREDDTKMDYESKKKVIDILKIIEEIDLPKDKIEEVQFHLDYGDVLFNAQEYDRALERYKKARHRDPDDIRVWNNMGVTLVRLGKTEEALKNYDKALEMNPANGSVWFNKGKILFNMGMKEEALACFENATKYSPESESAWNNLGVTLRHLSKYKESIDCYEKAIEIHSHYPWAWHNKGIALVELKRYRDAMRCFDKALQIDPDYEPSRRSKRELMKRLV